MLVGFMSKMLEGPLEVYFDLIEYFEGLLPIEVSKNPVINRQAKTGEVYLGSCAGPKSTVSAVAMAV